jgi:hypothetical protein
MGAETAEEPCMVQNMGGTDPTTPGHRRLTKAGEVVVPEGAEGAVVPEVTEVPGESVEAVEHEEAEETDEVELAREDHGQETTAPEETGLQARALTKEAATRAVPRGAGPRLPDQMQAGARPEPGRRRRRKVFPSSRFMTRTK